MIEKGPSLDSEAARKRQASEHGLPEDATWDQIRDVDSEAARKRQASERGLPEDATWGQISSHDSKK